MAKTNARAVARIAVAEPIAMFLMLKNAFTNAPMAGMVPAAQYVCVLFTCQERQAGGMMLCMTASNESKAIAGRLLSERLERICATAGAGYQV
ncbi:hypothetical protein MASR2M48_14840 [Spirochaetota bacterium]